MNRLVQFNTLWKHLVVTSFESVYLKYHAVFLCMYFISVTLRKEIFAQLTFVILAINRET